MNERDGGQTREAGAGGQVKSRGFRITSRAVRRVDTAGIFVQPSLRLLHIPSVEETRTLFSLFPLIAVAW